MIVSSPVIDDLRHGSRVVGPTSLPGRGEELERASTLAGHALVSVLALVPSHHQLVTNHATCDSIIIPLVDVVRVFVVFVVVAIVRFREVGGGGGGGR